MSVTLHGRDRRRVRGDGTVRGRIRSPGDLRLLNDEELEQLASELRAFLIDAVSRSGGHLGSNLGIVELTLALHRVFDSPSDPILFDTGHQAYVHKLVTGRASGFARLRRRDGLSGYPSRRESTHDWIENSHASTALSYAHGLAVSRAETDPDCRVAVVVGDGALTGGMAYEALSNIGYYAVPCVIVLNDNGRSYAPTVSPLFRDGRRATRAFVEALGLRYVGPLDGHDTRAMEVALAEARAADGPTLVHVRTVKGRGYGPAESDAEKCLHDVSAFDPSAGPTPPAGRTYSDVFGAALVELARTDRRIHAITAAMPGPVGLLRFAAEYPDRFHDVGIAEQHATGLAAGLAMGGAHPVVAVYSTFFTRAFDQANLDVGLHGLPVVFALDRAGVTGNDGPSHNGVLDVALLHCIPGMTVFAPTSADELRVMLRHALSLPGPSAIRFPKGPAAAGASVGSACRGRQVRRGGDATLLALGRMLAPAEGAARRLARHGVEVAVWDARCAQPLDPAMLGDAAAATLVVTIEDGVRVGGFGSAVADALTPTVAPRRRPGILNLGVPERYMRHADIDEILAEVGLDESGIVARVLAALEPRPCDASAQPARDNTRDAP